MVRGKCGRRGMCDRGHVWWGGMCGGVCMVGGMHGGGHVWQWVCVAGGMHGRGVRGRYYEIQSMSGRYASYWNAFLSWVFLDLGVVCIVSVTDLVSDLDGLVHRLFSLLQRILRAQFIVSPTVIPTGQREGEANQLLGQ